MQNESKDAGRAWMWGFLAVITVAQFYAVRELAAVFAFFAIGFAAIGFLAASFYMLVKCGELAVARLAWRTRRATAKLQTGAA